MKEGEIVNKKHFNEMMLDTAVNAEQVSAYLYDIAGIVSHHLIAETETQKDIHHDIWMHLKAKIKTYKPKKGDAYSFFYTVALNKGISILRIETKKDELFQKFVSGEWDTLKPIKKKDKPPETLEDLADIISGWLRSLSYQASTGSPDTYDHALSGCIWLQCVYFAIKGNYVDLSIGSHVWKGKRYTRPS